MVINVITEEEKNEIVEMVVDRIMDITVERLLLSIPETVGNMMASAAALKSNNEEFYKKHNEFAKHKDVVRHVVEQTEGKNPLLSHTELLEKSVPEIKRRIKTMAGMDMETVTSKPNLTFDRLDSPSDQHGKL